MSDTNVSLALVMENAKHEITGTVNLTIKKSGLPAYLVEGIIEGILADVRRQKNLELLAELTQLETRKDESEKNE